MVCREALLHDINDLHELYTKHLRVTEEILDAEKWTNLLKTLIENPDYHLLVGEVDGKVVVSVTLVVIKNLTYSLRPYAVIENVVTHSGFRRKGYASVLMEHASEIAQSKHCYKIMLMTGSKEEGTLRFYERCGFDMNEKTAFIRRF